MGGRHETESAAALFGVVFGLLLQGLVASVRAAFDLPPPLAVKGNAVSAAAPVCPYLPLIL